MPESTTVTPTTGPAPKYVEVISVVNFVSSILFAGVAILSGILMLTLRGWDILLPILVGFPISIGGSILLGIIPAVILRNYLEHPRVNWSLWISTATVSLILVAWLIVSL